MKINYKVTSHDIKIMDCANWTPNQDILNMIIEVLCDSIVPDTEIQRKVQEKLNTLQKLPDFANYLLFILKNAELYVEHTRALSAILLKNLISTSFDTLSESLLNFVRQECLQLITDPSNDVRASITTLIGVLVWKGNVSCWPNLIPHLCDLVDSPNNLIAETALMALFKISEEYLSKRGTEEEKQDESMNRLISKFTLLVTHHNFTIRKNSIRLLNRAMQDMLPVAKQDFDSKLYLTNVLQNMESLDEEMQKLICHAFVTFVEMQDVAIIPYLPIVMEYLLQKSNQNNGDVALQASEFWLAIAKLSNCKEFLDSHVSFLFPLLLENMKYSTYELNTLKKYLGDDEHLEDRVEDIRPVHVRSSVESNDEFTEELDSVGEPYTGWTLRKCSAASLDALALRFGDSLLPVFFPLMNEALNSNDYLIKESGILALGAIADGCLDGLRHCLPDLIKYLLCCVNHEHSLIRAIGAWSVGRYISWIIEDQQITDGIFVQVLTVLLEHFLDRNKRVQRAALSAFCVFQEEARSKLIPYIDFILQVYILCFQKYKVCSYLLLYDAISVFAQAVGNHLNKQEYIDLLLPPLMEKFNSYKDYYDEQFMALMECLSNVAVALEVGFVPYVEVIYCRCLVIISETVTAIQYYVENPNDFDAPERDPMCVAYDMLLGMVFGLKTYFVKFVTNSNLLSLIYYTVQDESVQVRQLALALYGELVKLCFSHLSSTVDQYIPIIIKNLDKHNEVACNNSAWVIGKLCIAMGSKMEPYANQILERLLYILQTIDGTKTMYQSTAIALCTLGLVCPDPVTPHLSIIIYPCCQAMRNVRDCEEKEIAFRGLCDLIMRNPVAITSNFIHFCDAVASFNEIRTDLKEVVKNILIYFPNFYGEANWMQFYEQFPPLLKSRLKILYDI